MGDVDKARHSYHRAVELDPHNGHAYVGLGELAMQVQDEPAHEAMRWLQHGVELLPEWSTAWMLLGAAQSEEAAARGGDEALLTAATQSVREAARLGPDDPNILWQLGEVLNMRGEVQEGVLRYAEAIRLQPDHIEAWSSLSRVLSYEALSALQRRLAHWAFRHALRAHPGHLETWHNLGEYLHANGEPAKAAVALKHATTIAPHSGASHLTLGESLQRLCRIDEARALPMFRNASGVAVRAMVDGLGSILPTALGTAGGEGVRIVESGYLTSEPGARAQAVHADTAPAVMRACEASTLKVQLALAHVTEDMGPLEVVPGSHEVTHEAPPSSLESLSAPSAAAQDPSTSAAAAAAAAAGSEGYTQIALPIRVQPGDVTIYWSSLNHRGGANTASAPRPTFHIAAIGEGGAPTGMPYTVLVDDVHAAFG